MSLMKLMLKMDILLIQKITDQETIQDIENLKQYLKNNKNNEL